MRGEEESDDDDGGDDNDVIRAFNEEGKMRDVQRWEVRRRNMMKSIDGGEM